MLKPLAFILSLLALTALGGCAGPSSYNLGAIESPVKESFGLDDVERQPGAGLRSQSQDGYSAQQRQMLMLMLQ